MAKHYYTDAVANYANPYAAAPTYVPRPVVAAPTYAPPIGTPPVVAPAYAPPIGAPSVAGDPYRAYLGGGEPTDEVIDIPPIPPARPNIPREVELPPPGAPGGPRPRSYAIPFAVPQNLLSALYPGWTYDNGNLVWGGTGDPDLTAEGFESLTVPHLRKYTDAYNAKQWQNYFDYTYGHTSPSSATLTNPNMVKILEAAGIRLGKPNAAGLTDSIILPDGTEVDVGYAFSANQPDQMRWVWNPITGRNEATPATRLPPPTDYTQGYGPLLEPWTTPYVPPPPAGPNPLAPAYEPPDLPTIDPFTFREFEAPRSDPFREFEAPTSDPFREFTWDRTWTPTSATDVLADPSYQWRLDQGRGALENSAAARGMLRGGGTLADLIKYGQNFASTEYGNIDARRRRDYDTDFDMALRDYAADQGTYFGNRDRAFNEAMGDYELDRGTYFGNRDRAFDEALADYNADRGTAFDVRNMNIRDLLALSDRAQSQYAARYAPKLLDWQTTVQTNERNDENANERAWRQYLTDMDIFRTNQANIWDRLRWQSEFGAGLV